MNTVAQLKDAIQKAVGSEFTVYHNKNPDGFQIYTDDEDFVSLKPLILKAASDMGFSVNVKLHTRDDDFIAITNIKPLAKESNNMNFPMLQMLAEAKKKSMDDMDADLDMDMEIDTSMEPVKKSKSMGDKKASPKGMKASAGDEVMVDKAAVLKFLKDCDPKCRADVHKKLMKMVEADEAAE